MGKDSWPGYFNERWREATGDVRYTGSPLDEALKAQERMEEQNKAKKKKVDNNPEKG